MTELLYEKHIAAKPSIMNNKTEKFRESGWRHNFNKLRKAMIYF